MTTFSSPALSKRAARRLIQRAFVIVGRDRQVRDHFREAHVVTRWTLADWNLSWTIELDRGRIHFERRPARHPDLTLTWPSAESFFRLNQNGNLTEEGLEVAGKLELRRYVEAVRRALGEVLWSVMQNPFDDEGNRIA